MEVNLEDKAINGSKKAIKKLVQRDSEFIYKLAFLHTKYEDDAKIILKNTALFINNNIGKSINYKSYEHYLIKVTIKHIKEYLNEIGMVDNKIEALYKSNNEIKVDLYSTIDILDTDLKSPTILRYFYNMNYNDVGDILEVAESTVKMYIRKSLKIMKNQFKDDFKYEGKSANTIIHNTDLDFLKEIENKIDDEIDKYIKDFYIDKDALNIISIPKDIKNQAIKPIKDIKKEKKKNIRYIVLDMIIVTIILAPIMGVIKPNLFKDIPQVYTVFYKLHKTFQKDNIISIIGLKNDNPIEGDIETSKNTEYILEKDMNKPENSYNAIKLIHSLANTLIEAEYKWQCGEVTPKTIELSLNAVELIEDDYDRMHLRNSIKKWSNGNFSNAVEVHNYVWEMLDGSVGKAYTLDKKEIEKIIEKYYK